MVAAAAYRVGNVRTLGAHSATPSGATPKPFCATTTTPRNKTLRCVSSFKSADASTRCVCAAVLQWVSPLRPPMDSQGNDTPALPDTRFTLGRLGDGSEVALFRHVADVRCLGSSGCGRQVSKTTRMDPFRTSTAKVATGGSYCDFFPEVARCHGGLLVCYSLSARRHAPGLTPTMRWKCRAR
jgi:hypothetical protein